MATILHVGFHKTGTTMLQRHFFPALPDTAVVGPLSEGFDQFHSLARNLCRADDGDYSLDPLHDWLAHKRDGFGSLVVSLEDFSQWHSDGRTAARLHAILPDAKVLICVRDQRTQLYSRYGGYVKKGGFRRFADYFADFDLDFLRYDLVVDSYQQLFGDERVKVLPFELLMRDADRYFAEVRTFVALDAGSETMVLPPIVNRGLASPTRWAVRQSNRLFVRSKENPRPLLRRLPGGRRVGRTLERLDSKLFPRMSRRLGRRDRALVERHLAQFAEGNARLELLSGLDLADYGYPLARQVSNVSA